MTTDKYIPMLKEWHGCELSDEDINRLSNFFCDRMEEFDDAMVRTITFNTDDFTHMRHASLGNFEVTLQRIKTPRQNRKTGEIFDLHEWRGIFTRGRQHLVVTGLCDWEW